MKISNINARIDKSGKHNDRNFDLDYAPHIDQGKVSENKYYTYNGDSEHSFSEIEKEFYEIHFSEYIEMQNQKKEQQGHRERTQTIDDYAKQKRTRPEDKILQIGNEKEHVAGEELWRAALAYAEKFNDIYGDHCKIVDMALHMDEETPHVHVRRVWIAEDENGIEFVNQTKALEQMGLTRPDMSKPESRYNNAKMSFTKFDNQLFLETCLEQDIELDRTPGHKRKHLSVSEYKAKKYLETADNTIESLKDFILSNQLIADRFREELDGLEEREREKQLEILERCLKQIIEENMINREYLENTGQTEAYEEYVRQQSQSQTKGKEEPISFF